MSEPKFPPMPTFMGKPLDTETLALDAARCMIAEAARLTKANERLRDTMREVYRVASEATVTSETLAAFSPLTRIMILAASTLEPADSGGGEP